LWLGGFRSSELLKVRLMCFQWSPYAGICSRRGGITQVLNEYCNLAWKKELQKLYVFGSSPFNLLITNWCY
jgi:hypothetical protein